VDKGLRLSSCVPRLWTWKVRGERGSTSRTERCNGQAPRSPRCAGSLRNLPLNADVGPQGTRVRESHFREGSLTQTGKGWLGLLGARRLVASPVQHWDPLPALWDGKVPTWNAVVSSAPENPSAGRNVDVVGRTCRHEYRTVFSGHCRFKGTRRCRRRACRPCGAQANSIDRGEQE